MSPTSHANALDSPEALQFIQNYPMALKDTLASPAIEAFVFQCLGHDVPWPAVKGVKAYAERFGHRPGTVRTGLSRLKSAADQELALTEVLTDGTSSYAALALGPHLQHFVRYFLQEPFQNEQFSLILTQLPAQATAERYALNDQLLRLGYVKFTSNGYLRYGGDPNRVNQWLQAQAFTPWVYHFEALNALPQRLEAELHSLYDLDFWQGALRDFETALEAFLASKSLDQPDGYLNYLFARSSFHKNIMTRAPYLPARYFAEVKRLKALYHYLGGLAQTRMQAHLALYKQCFVTPYSS